MSTRWQKILAVFCFGIFFGLLEAIVVIYLKQLLGIGEIVSNKKADPSALLISLQFIAFLKPAASTVIIANNQLLSLELYREAATIIMLATLGWVAGTKYLEKLAYFFLGFAVWDIFYYIFLKLITGWPTGLMDLDTFFLIPVAWVGPVVTPVLISSALILGSLWYLIKRGS